LNIRSMRSADLPHIAAMLRTSFDQELRPYMTYTQPGVASFLKVSLDYPKLCAQRLHLVSTDDDDVAVGYAEYVIGADGPDLLAYICVHEAYRGRGIATSLIGRCLESRGTSARVELDVFDNNTPALALYEGLGFVVGGERSWLRRQLPPCRSPIGCFPCVRCTCTWRRTASMASRSFRCSGGRDVVRLGRIGPGVLRCYDASSFADDDLLSRVRQVFPTLTEALLIADGAELPPTGVGAERIAHAIRLVAEGDSRNGRTERRP